MKGKIINVFTAAIIFMLSISATCGIAFVAWKTGARVISEITKVREEKKRTLASSSIALCAELVTVKNSYSGIVSIKKTRIAGLARSFSIVKYDAVLRAGIRDISKAKISVFDGGQSVRVVLPPCEILESAIVDFEIFDEEASVFVRVTTEEILEEIKKSRAEAQNRHIDAGLLNEAQKQAKQIVETVLFAAGFSSVIVESAR